MARGFFAQVVDACAGAAALYQQNPSPLVVDAGCGEGHYARALHGRLNARVIGVDIAKEAIAVAARGRQDGVLWLAADMAHMPIKAASADVMLNIFAPANYKEFKRVLKPGGILIKAAPGKAHLAQLRQRLNLPRDEEDLALIAGQMKKHCKFITRQSCARTMPLNKSELADMSGMTPLLFNRGGGEVMFDDIDEITIDAELFVAHMLLPT
ncbi:MAG: methyltransferase domain-containing protein [Clostridiales bacterium]|nr:methyltransferase domain-containing protein [Clostridiales bacterium]